MRKSEKARAVAMLRAESRVSESRSAIQAGCAAIFLIAAAAAVDVE